MTHTPTDLDALEALAKTATAGCWKPSRAGGEVWSDADPKQPLFIYAKASDSEFIAAIRNAAPALITELRAVLAQIDGWRNKCNEWQVLYQQRAHKDSEENARLRARVAELEGGLSDHVCNCRKLCHESFRAADSECCHWRAARLLQQKDAP